MASRIRIPPPKWGPILGSTDNTYTGCHVLYEDVLAFSVRVNMCRNTPPKWAHFGGLTDGTSYLAPRIPDFGYSGLKYGSKAKCVGLHVSVFV